MTVSYQGFRDAAATFEIDGTVREGEPVALTADGKVTACTAGQDFCGVAVSVRGQLAAVQLAGFVSTAYSGTAPAPGYQGLAADGAGGVKAAADGRRLLILQAGADNTLGFVLA